MLDTVPEAVLLDVTEKEKFKGHRAGHDAFMTAYSFASFIAQKLQESKREEGTDWMNLLGDIRNRLCLSGKTFPLVVQKSDFAKHSKGHLEKYDLIMNQMNQTENPSESWMCLTLERNPTFYIWLSSEFSLYKCDKDANKMCIFLSFIIDKKINYFYDNQMLDWDLFLIIPCQTTVTIYFDSSS